MISFVTNNTLMPVGALKVDGRAVAQTQSLGAGLRVKDTPPASPEVKAKTSVADNFQKEIFKRLTEARKGVLLEPGQTSPDPETLAQSLAGAAGEVSKIYGQETANEFMAKVLMGTAKKMNKDTLTSSIEAALQDIARLDRNGAAKMTELTKGFNQDLSLVYDQEKTEKKIDSGATLSLSYALNQYYGALAEPEEEGETVELEGFQADGAWGLFEVAEPDETTDEIRQQAEGALEDAKKVTIRTLLEKSDGAQEKLDALVEHLRVDLGDEDAAVYLEGEIKKALDLIEEKSLLPGPGLTDVLSKVYSKVALDLDAEQIGTFENYLNGAFKENLNQMLGNLQEKGVIRGDPETLGEIQFQGLKGLADGQETDSFTMTWGFKDNAAFEATVTRKALNEDVSQVKDAAAKYEEKTETNLARARVQLEDEKKLRDELARQDIRSGEGEAIEKPGGFSHLSLHDQKKNKKIWDDLRLTDAPEETPAEKQQQILEDVLGLKFGELSVIAQEEFKKKVQDILGEEEAEKYLASFDWKSNFLSTAAGLHRDLVEGGQADKAADFLNYINTEMSDEVNRFLSGREGLSWEGLTAAEGGPLQAVFSQRDGRTFQAAIEAVERSLSFNNEDNTDAYAILGLDRAENLIGRLVDATV